MEEQDIYNFASVKRSIFDSIAKWNETIELPYKLIIVGGRAFNTIIPPESQIVTSDLDLKLFYQTMISPEEYFQIFRNKFNKLRTKLMLDAKYAINATVKLDKPLNEFLVKNYHCFEKGVYFSVAVNYKRPYLIYSYKDTINCNNRYPEMVHMVISLIYHRKGSDKTGSLLDLSMSVNLNNPERLFQLPLNNFLHLSSYRQFSPVNSINLRLTDDCVVPVGKIGYLLADLLWLSLLHHKPEKRERANDKIKIIIKTLKEYDLPEHLTDVLESLLQQNYLTIGYTRLKRYYFDQIASEEVSPPELIELINLGNEYSLASSIVGPELLLKELDLLELILYHLNILQENGKIRSFPSHLLS